MHVTRVIGELLPSASTRPPIQLQRVLATLFAALALVTASTRLAFAGAPAALPYLVLGANHIVIGVQWDEAAVRKALPPGIRPVPGMTGAINVYQAQGGYGVTPYQAVYFWVDVEGFDSPTGIKGRWMLQGAYSSPAAEAFVAHYGFPVRKGSSRVESAVGIKRATGSVGGQDVVVLEIKPEVKPCEPFSTPLSYVAPRGQFAIPFAGQACEAQIVSAKVIAPEGDPFAAFRPVKLLWASEYRDAAFALSRPIPYP